MKISKQLPLWFFEVVITSLSVLVIVWGNVVAERILIFAHAAVLTFFGLVNFVAALVFWAYSDQMVGKPDIVAFLKLRFKTLNRNLIPVVIIVRMFAFVGAAHWWSAFVALVYLISYYALQVACKEVEEELKGRESIESTESKTPRDNESESSLSA